jgi:hypothetical protein
LFAGSNPIRLEDMLVTLLLSLLLPHTAMAANKLSCTAREIQRRDCKLNYVSYEIRLLPDTVVRDDGTWHTVDPMPLAGEGVDWEKIRVDVYQGWPVLQFWLWDKGTGEAQVQQLHWYVVDGQKANLKTLAENIVRRRRIRPPEGEIDPEELKKTKPVFIYDGMEKHDLKVLKNGNLELSLGKTGKIIEKVKHGI